MERYKLFNNYLTTHFGVINELSQESLEIMSHYYDLNYSNLLPKSREIKILDIGCGAGHFLYYLKKIGYSNFLGVDISQEMIDYCKKNVSESVEYVADLNAFLKKNSESFDAVVMNDVFEHFIKDDIVVILRLIKNSLKNGGTVIINTVNAACIIGNYNEHKDFTHETGFTELTLQQVLNLASFSGEITILPSKYYRITNFKRIIHMAANKTLHLLWRLIFYLEYSKIPKIVTDRIIAVAKKQK